MPTLTWKTCKGKPPELNGERCQNKSVNGTHFCELHGGLEGDGDERCMGRSRKTGVRCQQKPQPGRHYCKWHGGNHPIREDHHLYKNGKYGTAAMPVKLAEKYAITRQDTEIVELREEIALVDAMLMETLEQLSNKEGTDAWNRLHDAVLSFRKARASTDAYAMNEAMTEIENIVLHGKAAYAARKDLQSWLETRRKLTDSEIRRRKDLGDMITRAQTLIMIDKIVDLVKTYVPDHKSRTHLSAALLQLVGEKG